MKAQLKCIIRGKVQGVMFRDFVQRKAARLGIVGTVENQQDGSVLVMAAGEEKDLKRLLELLQRGPLLTRVRVRVDSVEAEWAGEDAGEENFSGFRIKY
jgi:acylphosphatase